MRRFLLRTPILTLLIVASVLLLQLLAQQSAQFMGKDIGSIATVLAKQYPKTLLNEFLLILGYVYLCTFVIVLVSRHILCGLAKASYLTVIITTSLSSVLCLSASVLKYPALYEEFLPTWLQYVAFRIAFIISPTILLWIAATIYIVPILMLLLQKRPQLRLKTTMTLLALVAIGSCHLASESPRMSQPHVLFIGIDSLRSDRLAKDNVLPHINALLQDPQTVYFSNHLVGVPRTFPSWTEILQGEYAVQTGVRHMFPSLKIRDGERPGLATALRDSGYLFGFRI